MVRNLAAMSYSRVSIIEDKTAYRLASLASDAVGDLNDEGASVDAHTTVFNRSSTITIPCSDCFEPLRPEYEDFVNVIRTPQ